MVQPETTQDNINVTLDISMQAFGDTVKHFNAIKSLIAEMKTEMKRYIQIIEAKVEGVGKDKVSGSDPTPREQRRDVAFALERKIEECQSHIDKGEVRDLLDLLASQAHKIHIAVSLEDELSIAQATIDQLNAVSNKVADILAKMVNLYGGLSYFAKNVTQTGN